MDETILYYDTNAESFANDTLAADISPIRDTFCSLLPPGAEILDLGCGAGRDSKAFLEKGFVPTPVDGSREMCRVASETTGLETRQLLFLDLDYENEFDGVWACSSLLHCPKDDLPKVFALIHRALKPNGVFYSSFKLGSFEGNRNGRFFTDLDEASFLALSEDLFTPEKIWITSDARPGRENEKWLNAIAVRKG